MARGRRQDHYEVLGVQPDAPDEVIRAAYRALAAKYHPDKNPGDAKAELTLKRVNAAYRVVGDPEKRRQYDELTQTAEAHDDDANDESSEAPRRHVTEGERPGPPRWKVPGEGERAHSVKEPQVTRRQPTNKGVRVLLALGAAATSLAISLSSPGHSVYAEVNPEWWLFGMLIGCGALAIFIYWLAGKVGPMVCAFVFALIALTIFALRDDSDVKHRSAAATTSETATPVATPAVTTTTVPVPVPAPVAQDDHGNPLWVYDAQGNPLSISPLDVVRIVAAGRAGFLKEAHVMVVTRNGHVTSMTGDQVPYAFQKGARIASPDEVAGATNR